MSLPTVSLFPLCTLPSFSLALVDASVRVQVRTLKTAIEASRVLLRVDDVVKATRKDKEQGGGSAPPPEEMVEG